MGSFHCSYDMGDSGSVPMTCEGSDDTGEGECDKGGIQ